MDTTQDYIEYLIEQNVLRQASKCICCCCYLDGENFDDHIHDPDDVECCIAVKPYLLYIMAIGDIFTERRQMSYPLMKFLNAKYLGLNEEQNRDISVRLFNKLKKRHKDFE